MASTIDNRGHESTEPNQWAHRILQHEWHLHKLNHGGTQAGRRGTDCSIGIAKKTQLGEAMGREGVPVHDTAAAPRRKSPVPRL